MAGQRRPGAHARGGARLRQVDRRATTEVMTLAVTREILFMGAPAQLRRLLAFGHEAIDRPGVDELVGLLGNAGHLRVALGHMHDLHADAAGQLGPLLARGGFGRLQLRIAGQLQQRLLDEVRDQARVGAMRHHRSGATRIRGTQGQRFLAQGVVGALGHRRARIGIATGPGLDAGVQVHGALFPAVLDERQAGDVDRNIEEEVTAAEQRLEDAAVVLAHQRFTDEFHAEFLRFLRARVLRGHDSDAFGLDADVAQDQRQDTLPDAAKTDNQDTTREINVNRVCHDL